MKTICSIFLMIISLNLLAQNSLVATEDNALLEVLVTNMEDQIRPKDKIVFEGKHTHQSFEGISDDSGKFQILLPEGDIYQIKIKGLADAIDFDELQIPKQAGKIRGTIVVKYRPAKSFNLDDVHFETNKSILLSSSFATLDQLVEALELKPTLKLEISGHTDSVGEEESNLQLSQNRAQAVVNYLAKKGINTSRLVAKGYGETDPIADNETKEGRQENRRTEARVLEQ